MSLEDKVEKKPLTLDNEQRLDLNARNYKLKFLESQAEHFLRSFREISNQAQDVKKKLEADVAAIGLKHGIELAGWDEETGILFEKPGNGQTAPQQVG